MKLQDTCRKISSEMFDSFQAYHNSGIIDDQLKNNLLQSKEKFIKHLHDLEKEGAWYEKKYKKNDIGLIEQEAVNIYRLLITYQKKGKAFLTTIEQNIMEEHSNLGRTKKNDVGAVL